MSTGTFPCNHYIQTSLYISRIHLCLFPALGGNLRRGDENRCKGYKQAFSSLANYCFLIGALSSF